MGLIQSNTANSIAPIFLQNWYYIKALIAQPYLTHVVEFGEVV